MITLVVQPISKCIPIIKSIKVKITYTMIVQVVCYKT